MCMLGVLQEGPACNNSNYEVGFANKTTSLSNVSHYSFFLSSSTGTDGLSLSQVPESVFKHVCVICVSNPT